MLQEIKNTVLAIEPNATVILNCSCARGDYRPNSVIDIIILADKEKIIRKDKIKITYPIYDVEQKNNTVISPIVYTKQEWKEHDVTPLYENVINDGIIL